MDDAASADQEHEAPEITVARTRELLTRSRTTLDMLTKRLQARQKSSERPHEPMNELQA